MNSFFLSVFIIFLFAFSKADGKDVDCTSEKSVDKFKVQTDFFYNEKDYESIKKLSICYLNKYKTVNYIYECYLASLYFTNDSIVLKSFLRDSLLNKGEIEKLVVYLNNDNRLIIDLMCEKNFRRMLNAIFKEYFNNKPFSDEKYFIYSAIIEDQAIRFKYDLTRQNYSTALDSINKIKSKEAAREFQELSKINNTKVYQFYKIHKKIFSSKELGSAYVYQLILFAHETDLNRRLFFQSLIESAVEKGVCRDESLWTFLIKTKEFEINNHAKFQDELPKIMNDLRTKYIIPEDYFYSYF